MKLQMISILDRWTRAPLWTGEAASLGDAVVRAIARGAILTGADLAGADLTGADLRDAVMRRVDLTGADLTGADLTRVNIRGAVLAGVNLTGVNLTDADLRGSDLTGAVLTGAVLTGVSLAGANLTNTVLTSVDLTGSDLTNAVLTNTDIADAVLARVNLTGANLADAVPTRFREDVEAVLALAPNEVPGLLLALREGRIDGSCYDGDCACLVGTIANLRGVGPFGLGDLRPDADRPAERWFLAIRPGHTPERSHVVSITIGWIEAWQAARAAEATLHTTRRTHG